MDTKVTEEELVSKYNKYYDKNLALKLLKKLRKATRDKTPVVAGAAGTIVNYLGKLLSALENPDCPAKWKAMIIGAIGYIVLPLDIIPDAIPGLGWTDDVGAAACVVTAVSQYSDFSLKELDAAIDRENKSEKV